MARVRYWRRILLHLRRLERDTLGEWLIHRAVGDAGVQRNGDVVGDRASQRGPMPRGADTSEYTSRARLKPYARAAH